MKKVGHLDLGLISRLGIDKRQPEAGMRKCELVRAEYLPRLSPLVN